VVVWQSCNDQDLDLDAGHCGIYGRKYGKDGTSLLMLVK
jgi:hypothetical protein